MEPLAQLEEAVKKLAALAAAQHPAARARDAAAALLEGMPVDEALTLAGAPAPVARLVKEAAPAELPAVLGEIAAAWGRAQERRRALADLALYPALLALLALGLAGITNTALRPFAVFLAQAQHADAALPYPTAATIALALSLAALAALSAVLWLGAAVFPVKHARIEQDRALVLSAAASLAEHGTDLAAALRAAAHLGHARQVRAAATSLAVALERGEVQQEGVPLLGTIGAGLFRAAAAQGAGAAALGAVADLHEAHTASEGAATVLRLQFVTLLLGGMAIAAAASAFLGTYASAFGVLR